MNDRQMNFLTNHHQSLKSLSGPAMHLYDPYAYMIQIRLDIYYSGYIVLSARADWAGTLGPLLYV